MGLINRFRHRQTRSDDYLFRQAWSLTAQLQAANTRAAELEAQMTAQRGIVNDLATLVEWSLVQRVDSHALQLHTIEHWGKRVDRDRGSMQADMTDLRRMMRELNLAVVAAGAPVHQVADADLATQTPPVAPMATAETVSGLRQALDVGPEQVIGVGRGIVLNLTHSEAVSLLARLTPDADADLATQTRPWRYTK